MFNIKYDNKAFSLVEVIIALGVFAILAAGVFSVATNSYQNFYGVGDKQSLTEFAQEGIEIARAIRDNSWQKIEDVSGSGNQGVVQNSVGYWEFSGTSNILGALTRAIVVTDVERDANSEIVASGGTDDVNTKKIVVTVTGTGIDYYVLTTYLTNWSNKSWIQTDWSGTEAREWWSNNTMASSSYDGSINTSTSGQISMVLPTSSMEYLYSSIYDLGSSDIELKSITVEQNIPTYCQLDIILEVSEYARFGTSDISSHTFSNNTVSYFTSSTPASLNGKKYLRYKLEMSSCNANLSGPTLYSLKINYR